LLLIVLTGLFLTLSIPLLSGWRVDAGCNLVKRQEFQIQPSSLCEARQRLYGELKDPEAELDLKLLGRKVAALSDTSLAVYQIWERRMDALAGQFVLLVMVGLAAARLLPGEPRRAATQHDSGRDGSATSPVRSIITYSPATGFALLLIAAGATLAFIPDVIYLRDNFGTRMNTIFKLYYQSWTLFSIGGAFAVYSILFCSPRRHDESQPRSTVQAVTGKTAFAAVALALLAGGLLYPYYAIQSRMIHESGRLDARRQIAACQEAGLSDCPEEQPLTLNSEPTIVGAISPDEWAVIRCLAQLEPRKNDATLVEAPEGGYTPHLGRVSMLTGIPTLLGWDNHERQWRGETYNEVVGDRPAQIEKLYTGDWTAAQEVIRRFGIDYVMVGNAEYSRYGNHPAGLSKFADLLDPVCKSGDIAIYRVSAE
jgi:hypothetical protein